MVAIRAIKGTLDYFFPFFFIYPEFQIPFTYGTG